MLNLPTLPPGSTICIIGGGSSGIFAIREALRVGWVPTLYEQSKSSGGVWRSDNHWHSLTTNSSMEMMQVSGHPFPFTPSGVFPTRNEICAYIQSFVDKFDVSPYIQYNTKVVSVRRSTANNKKQNTRETWNVTTTTSTEQHTTTNFDIVLVASGQFNLRKFPSCLQSKSLLLSNFTGTVLHSREFRQGSDYVGKNVLVVGLGNSSLDVALECASAGGAASVTVACRRGSIILPIQNDDGTPVDQKIGKFFTRHEETHHTITRH